MKCANPACPKTIDPERVAHGAKTCDSRCRAAAHRARWGYLPVSDGGPRPMASQVRSHGSRSKPSGPQVSYRKAVDAVAAELGQLRRFGLTQLGDETERESAERVLRAVLSVKQRERVAAVASRRKEASCKTP